MLIFSLLLLTLGCAVALYRWRWGFLAAILLGFVQDPLRKMMPGTPGIMTMYTLPVWVAALASAYAHGHLRPRQFMTQFPRLGRWIGVFGLYLIIPAALSVSHGRGTWQITLLGAMVYLVVFFIVTAGYTFSVRREDAVRVMQYYAVLTGMALLGGLFEYMGHGDHFDALGTQALGNIWVTYRTGEAMFMYAGFFRGPDVMGWHAALLTMIASFMAFRSRGWMRLFWVSLCVWGLFNVWICGRRKMVSMLPVFWSCYLFLIFRFRNVRWIIPTVGTLLLIIAAGWYVMNGNENSASIDTFYMTTIDDIDERLIGHGVGAVLTTIRQAGFWGYGLGMAQQGIHHINAEKPRVWQEGGPGKIVVELGVPGGILFIILLAVLIMTAFHMLSGIVESDLFMPAVCIMSLITANLASGIVSAQIFGDPFIILLLALLIGLLLSFCRVESLPGEKEC